MGNNLLKKSLVRRESATKSKISTLIDASINFAEHKLVSRFSRSIVLSNRASIEKFLDFLSENDRKFIEHSSSIRSNSDTFFIISLDVNTFMTVLVGNPLMSYSDKYVFENISVTKEENVELNCKLKITIFGKYADKYLKIIQEKTASKSANQLVIYNVSSYSKDSSETFQSVINDLHERSLDTLFYSNNIKEDIVAHIDSFFENKKVYEARNINFKTGVLLYGEPGTGKSSLANAIASKYKLNVVLVDMNTFATLDVGTLTSCINGDDKTYVVLIEDIDTIFNVNRADEEAVDKDDKKIINKLLQFLDSNSSPSNVIFIATTNYPERLDAAITRAGRFDKKFYIGPLNKEEALKMCRSFEDAETGIIFTDEDCELMLENCKNDKNLYNPSSLQAEILGKIKQDTLLKSNNDNEEEESEELL